MGQGRAGHSFSKFIVREEEIEQEQSTVGKTIYARLLISISTFELG